MSNVVASLQPPQLQQQQQSDRRGGRRTDAGGGNASNATQVTPPIQALPPPHQQQAHEAQLRSQDKSRALQQQQHVHAGSVGNGGSAASYGTTSAPTSSAQEAHLRAQDKSRALHHQQLLQAAAVGSNGSAPSTGTTSAPSTPPYLGRDSSSEHSAGAASNNNIDGRDDRAENLLRRGPLSDSEPSPWVLKIYGAWFRDTLGRRRAAVERRLTVYHAALALMASLVVSWIGYETKLLNRAWSRQIE